MKRLKIVLRISLAALGHVMEFVSFSFQACAQLTNIEMHRFTFLSFLLVFPFVSFTRRPVPFTAVSRKVVGKSERDNPERYCGWF